MNCGTKASDLTEAQARRIAAVIDKGGKEVPNGFNPLVPLVRTANGTLYRVSKSGALWSVD